MINDHYNLSYNLHKRYQATETVAKTSDLIIEVVDARIVASAINLLPYDNFKVKKPRIIYFSFEDAANPKIVREWRLYLQKHQVFVVPPNFFATKNFVQLLKMLNDLSIIKFQHHDLLRVAIISIPNSGRDRLIKKIKGGLSLKANFGNLFGKTKTFTSASIKFIKPKAIIPWGAQKNNRLSMRQLFNFIILNKIDNSFAITKSELVCYLLPELIKHNLTQVKQFYHLEVPKKKLTKQGALKNVDLWLKQIALNKSIKNEFGNFDVEDVYNRIKHDLFRSAFRFCLDPAQRHH